MRKEEFCDILRNHFLASIATKGKDFPEIAIVFYVFDGQFLYFKSRTASSHAVNIHNFENVSVSLYSHDSTYEAKYGIQIRGKATRVTDVNLMKEVVKIYSFKYQGAGEKLLSLEDLCSINVKSTFYKIEIAEFKIIDEDKETNRTMLTYEKY